jgi:hypothetical protein
MEALAEGSQHYGNIGGVLYGLCIDITSGDDGEGDLLRSRGAST